VKSSTEVSLSGSFANASDTPTEVGFYYGTSSGSKTYKKIVTAGSDGSFSADITGLAAGTKYYWRPYVKVSGTGSYASQSKEVTGSESTFTTQAAPSAGDVTPAQDKSWLELPGAKTNSNYVVNTYYNGSTTDSNRNYTHLYDKSTYTSLWTAYHLNSSHMGSESRPSKWSFSPSIAESLQVDLCSSSYESSYSRGHMIPNASRNGIKNMQLQTFYVTNSVPQIQDNFNGGIWQNLEAALQSIGKKEEIYIVTGVAFSKVGESKTVKTTKAKDDDKTVPVPNYFYKVVLKVEKSGSTVTSAMAVGFWFEHKTYSDSYTNYAVSVDQIEQWTGFDFFVNLPDTIENSAESNISWSTFQSF
jgi:endonuclease G